MSIILCINCPIRKKLIRVASCLFLMLFQSCSSNYQPVLVNGVSLGFEVGQVFVSTDVTGYSEIDPNGFPQGLIGVSNPWNQTVSAGTEVEVIKVFTGYSGTFGKNTVVYVKFRNGSAYKIAQLSGDGWAQSGPKVDGYDYFLIPSSSLRRIR